jgi:hypothetical protein
VLVLTPHQPSLRKVALRKAAEREVLSFIWMCVISMFLPASSQMAEIEAAAFQAHLRSQLEISAPVPAAIGAAQHVAHYAIPALAR